MSGATEKTSAQYWSLKEAVGRGDAKQVVERDAKQLVGWPSLGCGAEVIGSHLSTSWWKQRVQIE